MLKIFVSLSVLLSLTCFTNVFADLSVPIYFTTPQANGKLAGNVVISETKYGLLFKPDLQGLPPGLHGFHIHQNPTCAENGMAAGGHFDPKGTGKHLGPYNDQGHLGDLPALYVAANGTATEPVLAPRILHIDDIKYHALMIHEGGDNYSDSPKKLGGGEKRIACGVIK